MTDRPSSPFDPPTHRQGLRDDILAALTVSAVILLTMLFVVLPPAVFLAPGWATVGAVALAAAAGAMLPLIVLACLYLENMLDRHLLDRDRIMAERRMLTVRFDLDTDGDKQLEDAEMQAFLDYVKRLHVGRPTTADYASRELHIPAPTWQKYRNVLITIGLAHSERKRGGKGFTLLPAVIARPWSEIEQHIRKEAGLLVRPATSPGMLITAPPARRQFAAIEPDIDAVSTLGRD